MPKRKIENDRTRRYPHLAMAIRLMEKAPEITEQKTAKKQRKNRREK